MPNLDPATRARLADALEGATPERDRETFAQRVLRLTRQADLALAALLRTSETTR